MAIAGAVAFGGYLRTIRERRRLSLVEVCERSCASPRTIDKGTLSRFERGQQRLALSVLSPLCRIYGIAADALLERMELDAELDRIGGPDTAGKSAAELRRLGRHALLQESRKWDAYAYFRDATAVSPDDGFQQTADDPDRERALAALNLATVARSLGKNRFALHELVELEATGAVGDRFQAVVLDRISNCCRCVGETTAAERYVVAALERAREIRDERMVAFSEFSRASLALDTGEQDLGVELLLDAFRRYRESRDADASLPRNPTFEASALTRLAEAFLDANHDEKAGRFTLAARRLATQHGLAGVRAYADLFLGRVEERSGKRESALGRWWRVAREAERLGNQRLGFSAEFFIFRSALVSGNRALARASRRRLDRMAPWVPAHLPVLTEFRGIAGERNGGAVKPAVSLEVAGSGGRRAAETDRIGEVDA